MNPSNTSPWIEALLGSVSDGQPVDWDAMAEAAPDADSLRFVRTLQQVTRATPGHAAPEFPGDHQTRFVALRHLGRGSYGDVWMAEDRDLGRTVAIKLLDPAPASQLRWRDEARRLAAIRHPNVVHIHGIEVLGDRPALVLESIHGRSLAEHSAMVGRLGAEE